MTAVGFFVLNPKRSDLALLCKLGLLLQKLGMNDAIKSCRTLFIVLIMMIICWTPYTVVILIDFKDLQSMEVSDIDHYKIS